MTATETMSDPASSLRALALSTLRSKRRKPAAVQPLMAVPMSRIQPPPMPSSDAMQLDYGEDEILPKTSLATRRMEDDPPFSREEGEISDEEGSSKQNDTPTSATEAPKPTPKFLPTLPVSSLLRNGGLSLLDRITDAPDVLPAMIEHSQPSSERISSPPVSPIHSRVINNHQVRPNVHLNQSQYDTAKDIVLDLLGWGVAPEYLVDCGLSRELIYYVFTELKLRLPDNLDIAGLLPYNPDTVKSFSFIEPVRPLKERLREDSIPSRPDALANGEATPTLVSQGDLHDIEKLRRQELIARKAVQASRRSRKLNGINTATAQVPSETVEDFLKTIPSSAENISANPPSVDMHVDESSSSHTPTDLVITSVSQEVHSLGTPPSSTDSMMTTFKSVMQMSPETVAPVHHFPTHRGMKRPVAADFVDLDTNTRTIDRDLNGSTPELIRKKTWPLSFANVRPTKCVIDLSDSESDDDGIPSASTPQNGFFSSSNRVNIQSKSQALSHSTPATGTVTPSTLEETEKEIQRMREWIAQREQKSLLKKLGLKSPTVNIDENPSASETPALRELNTASTPISIQNLPTPSSLIPLPPSTSPDLMDTTTLKTSQDHSPDSEPPKAAKIEAESEASSEPYQRPASADRSVDVDTEMSSSAQVLEAPTSSRSLVSDEEQHENPMAHDSLFASYPLLRLSLPPSLAGAWSTLKVEPSKSDNSILSSSLPLPDLKPLREASLIKEVDPSKFLCQYEIPGGGVCRDASCEDVHLSKLDDSLSAEPNDCDTAKYICSIYDGLPFDSTFSKLRQERLKRPLASLEARVAQVLASQRSSLPEPPPTT